jgi:hypothetical protein
MQLPLLQTMFEPHVVPFGWFPVSEQTGDPVAQLMTPVLQTVVGWQVAPAAQAMQVPALQTMPVPQPSPLASALPVSVQPMLGEQTVMPPWHGLAGWQADPAEHGMQAPPWQTFPAPQTVPFGWLPDSTQTDAPVLHVVVPLLHGLPGTAQSAPAMHATQAPRPSHTWSVPQAAPAATFVFASMHEIEGEQTWVPLWHLLVGTHGVFA